MPNFEKLQLYALAIVPLINASQTLIGGSCSMSTEAAAGHES